MGRLDIDEGSVHDTFVRHIPHGADPLFQPPYPPDGRWQRGGIVAAWYFADEPATAWAGLPAPIPAMSRWAACQEDSE